MNSRIFTITLCLIFNLSFSQKDTLKSLDSTYHSEYIDSLNHSAYRLARIDVANATILVNKALKLSHKNNYQKGIGYAYNCLSLIHFTKGERPKSFETNIKSLEIGKAIKDSLLISRGLGNYAIDLELTHQTKEALANYLEAYSYIPDDDWSFPKD